MPSSFTKIRNTFASSVTLILPVPIKRVGKQFDPRQHEALESIETAEHPDHQVLEEVRRGYKIKDRLLRPALVRVVHNPSQKEI